MSDFKVINNNGVYKIMGSYEADSGTVCVEAEFWEKNENDWSHNLSIEPLVGLEEKELILTFCKSILRKHLYGYDS